MKIFYGVYNILLDVTNICLTKLMHKNIITIPSSDYTRANYFGDPIVGTIKKIFILNDNVLQEYSDNYVIFINTINNTISTSDARPILDYNDINMKIKNLHSKLKIIYGSFNDELPEQKMVLRYLTGTEKVLEIGGNIGRNSLIIASILNNSNNLVTLESNEDIAKQLTDNRNLNKLYFHIENSALSKRKLIQKECDSIPSDILFDGYTWIKTITFNELETKYNIKFDTLVIDCEGAFYYILIDMPEILNNINLIIMENDYHDFSHKQYVDQILIKNNFNRDYVESGGWGACYNNFFEVWKKTII